MKLLLTAFTKETIRKTIHMFTFSIVIIHIISQQFALVALLVAIIGYAVSELFRLKKQKIFYIHDLVEICARKEEIKSFILTPFLLVVSIFFTFLLFTPEFSYPAIFIATFSDSLSTLVGLKFGKRKLIYRKTLEGSITFFIVSLIILLFFISPAKALTIALITTFLELFSGKIDNFTLPLGAAASLTLLY